MGAEYAGAAWRRRGRAAEALLAMKLVARSVANKERLIVKRKTEEDMVTKWLGKVEKFGFVIACRGARGNANRKAGEAICSTAQLCWKLEAPDFRKAFARRYLGRFICEAKCSTGARVEHLRRPVEGLATDC